MNGDYNTIMIAAWWWLHISYKFLDQLMIYANSAVICCNFCTTNPPLHFLSQEQYQTIFELLTWILWHLCQPPEHNYNAALYNQFMHCKKLEVNLTQKRSSQLHSGFIIQFKMGYLSCRIYTTSHFYHSVGLQCLCTQSSNMAWILA